MVVVDSDCWVNGCDEELEFEMRTDRIFGCDCWRFTLFDCAESGSYAAPRSAWLATSAQLCPRAAHKSPADDSIFARA